MTILVTGGAGYVGGHMVLGLLDRGEPLVVIDDMSNGAPWAIPPGVDLVQADVRDYGAVSDTLERFEVTEIVHLAGRLSRAADHGSPLACYQQNTVGGAVLLQAAIDHGVERLVFSSTAAVYGEARAAPLSEDDAIAPITPYGASKWMVERMLQDVASATSLAFVALRYFNVAGADPGARYGQSTKDTTMLIQVAVRCALGLSPRLEMFGDDYATPDGACVRDYIHVADLIDAHVAALAHLRGGGESLTLNCGYGRGFSVKEVVAAIKRVSGHDFDVRIVKRRSGDAAAVIADATRIRRTLGWRPRFDDLDTMIEHALRWEQALALRGGPV